MIPRPAHSWERSTGPMALPSNLMGCGICWSSATEFISRLESPTKNTDCLDSSPKTEARLNENTTLAGHRPQQTLSSDLPSQRMDYVAPAPFRTEIVNNR